MQQKEITIQGKQYPVVFTMDTLMNFERIVNKSFFESDFKTLVDRMALIYAAVVTVDDNTDLTVEAMKGDKNIQAIQQIIAAYTVVAGLMGKFFEVPEVVTKEEQAEAKTEEEGEKQKN